MTKLKAEIAALTQNLEKAKIEHAEIATKTRLAKEYDELNNTLKKLPPSAVQETKTSIDTLQKEIV